MNKNCENIKNSDSCNYCNYCNFCNFCNYCYSCNSCNYCNFCNFCNYCYSCNFCNFCDSCNYCNSCNFCNFCNSCNSCDSCNSCNSCNFCNSCKFSYGLRMSERMIFCLGEGKYERKGEGYQKNYRIFNKDVSQNTFDEYYNSQPNFKLPISVWKDKKEMTEQEIKDNPICNQIGGYLKVLSYKDAWKEGWITASQEFKDWVKSLPNFDADLFEKITGIKFT